MDLDSQLLYKLGLTLINGIGLVNARKLLAACGDAKSIFDAKPQKLLSIHGIGQQVVSQLKEKDKILRAAEEEIQRCEREKISCIFFADSNFPKRLRACEASPLMLFVKGNCDLENEHVLAVVGTRKPTDYGKRMTAKIIEELKAINPLIISGLAYGVDACCHKNCLSNAIKTAAVLGHGFAFLYPELHRKLSRQIISDGGMLISQFPYPTKPDRENFPMRNRIIAGLSDALLVIESDTKGGSMISARMSQKFNRDLFALPGPANSRTSRGCNLLIKENVAQLIESGADIIKAMNWQPELRESRNIQRSLFAALNPEETRLTECFVENKPTHRDSIGLQSQMTPGQIAMTLLSLEMKGLVRSLPGNFYQLLK